MMKPFISMHWFNPRHWSFRTRLTLSAILLVALAMTSATIITTVTVQAALTEQIGQRFEAEAESLSDLVSAFFLAKVSQMQALALTDAVKEAVVERNASYVGSADDILTQIQALDEQWVAAPDDDPLILNIITPKRAANPAAFQLQRFLEAFPEHSEIFVTDRYGATIAATGRLSDYYQADEGWWQAAWNNGEGAVYISSPEFDESAGVTASLVAVPIFKPSPPDLSRGTREQGGTEGGRGELIGVLRSTLVLDDLLRRVIAQTTIGETGHAVLFDLEGEVLLDPHGDSEIGSAGLSADLRQRFVEVYQTAYSKVALDEKRQESIFGYSRLHAAADAGSLSSVNPLEEQIMAAVVKLGWTVVVRQKAAEAFAPLEFITQAIQLIGLIIMAISAILAGLLATTVTRPLQTLSQAAAQIGAGNLDAPLPAAGGDEIGHLTTSFSNMTVRLRELISELTGRTETLQRYTQQLEAERNLLNSILTTLPVGVYVSDRQGAPIRTNQMARTLFGRRIVEQPTKDLVEIYQAVYTDSGLPYPEEQLLLVRTLSDGLPHSNDKMAIIQPDGTKVALLVNSGPLLDQNGQMIGATVVFSDISERRRVERALRESEERFRRTFNDAPSGMALLKPNGHFIQTNKAMCEMLGYTEEELLTGSFRDITSPDDREIDLAKRQQLQSGQIDSFQVEKRYCHKKGAIVWVLLSVSAVRHHQGQLLYSIAHLQNITERKRAKEALQRAHDELEMRVSERTAELQRANRLLQQEISERKRVEEQLQASLEEKVVLLKEIHHRVKNNLQIISSLLYLQSDNIKDKATRQMFKDSQNRVKSMALIHEQLYQTDNLARIDLADYIQRLTNHLSRSYGANHISLQLKIEPLFLTIETAIPCGLIINELVTNALKYAFPAQDSRPKRAGQIWVAVQPSDNHQLTLSVRDNGVGFPNDVNFRRTRSLGLTLVMTLVKQIKGTIELLCSDGTEFQITFTDSRTQIFDEAHKG